MQNDEDFNSLAVQTRIRDQYLTIVNEQLTKSRYSKLSNLIEAVDRDQIDYKQLMFVCQLLPNLSNIGLDALEQNTPDLLQSLKN